MVIKSGDLINFGLRKFHRFGQRRHVRSGKCAVFILNLMQEFDQQIAPHLAARQQRGDLRARLRIDLAALGRVARLHLVAHFGEGYCDSDAVIHRGNLRGAQAQFCLPISRDVVWLRLR